MNYTCVFEKNWLHACIKNYSNNCLQMPLHLIFCFAMQWHSFIFMCDLTAQMLFRSTAHQIISMMYLWRVNFVLKCYTYACYPLYAWKKKSDNPLKQSFPFVLGKYLLACYGKQHGSVWEYGASPRQCSKALLLLLLSQDLPVCSLLPLHLPILLVLHRRHPSAGQQPPAKEWQHLNL